MGGGRAAKLTLATEGWLRDGSYLVGVESALETEPPAPPELLWDRNFPCRPALDAPATGTSLLLFLEGRSGPSEEASLLSPFSCRSVREPKDLGLGLVLVSIHKIFLIFSTKAFRMLYMLTTPKSASPGLVSPLSYRLVNPAFYLTSSLRCLMGI